MERDFKGIWIGKNIWLNKDLTVMEKLFLVEIDSLDNEDGCFASNKYFSDFFNLSKNRCTEIIKSLEMKGLISIKLVRKDLQIVKRVIKVKGIRKTEQPYSENSDNPIRKTEQPYSENSEGNNTLISNPFLIRESLAIDFLKLNNPLDFESFLIQNKKLIKQYEKFEADFNDTVDIEKLPFDQKVLFARLRKYARNYIANQNKFNAQEETNVIPIYRRKIS